MQARAKTARMQEGVVRVTAARTAMLAAKVAVAASAASGGGAGAAAVGRTSDVAGQLVACWGLVEKALGDEQGLVELGLVEEVFGDEQAVLRLLTPGEVAEMTKSLHPVAAGGGPDWWPLEAARTQSELKSERNALWARLLEIKRADRLYHRCGSGGQSWAGARAPSGGCGNKHGGWTDDEAELRAACVLRGIIRAAPAGAGLAPCC